MLRGLSAYLIPSLTVHLALFVGFASTPSHAIRAAERPVEVLEFVTISEEGGGRLGNDDVIGDAPAPQPEKPPEKVFRRVKPKSSAPAAVPSEAQAPPETSGVEGAQDGIEGEETPDASGGSLVSGSAGTDPDVTQAGVGSGGQGVDRRTALRAWLREIQREANKIALRNYPASAIRMRLEGKVRIGIEIGGDGGILGVRIMSSSGHAMLDESARESVRGLRIPAPPEELQWHAREVVLPIRYALE